MTIAPARGLLAAVRFYQRAISPAFPPRCRFEPTCSAYAAEAIEVHGAGRGSWLAVRRLAKCAPWHPGGVDFVPPRRGGAAAGDGPPDPGSGTAGPTHSSCTAAHPPEPSAATASTADGTRRPDRATPPAPRRSAQQEAGVA
ncbi:MULTISPECIES: membrane protein insertion efficiency factor YidD [unclassified Modestobacter]|uniref:membrane protein insertion efficiency factor YidD n=1 Tax=unclassified Modestobacter TaxID=2643866 RepID=UPI0022AA5C27|nr:MULTISPECIES: membrane protein insertion efficiency factor YidD [unclassified Modestobacter]MCZ2810906.1 membrane protein insertion efficiency factor YidD [Modestobacter sp. VKM Ac-2979]MCZ2840419.1 membrane protein insertion efficiency factor YidD [Modestobacter sp. VKM Ac-2980]MCZ2849547.1 membrane protein insertion efficiency factor YidD [Modestobacter sp. VKM Ac-2978]